MILAHVDGTDLGVHHVLPLLAGLGSGIAAYFVVFWSNVRAWIKDRRSRRQR